MSPQRQRFKPLLSILGSSAVILLGVGSVFWRLSHLEGPVGLSRDHDQDAESFQTWLLLALAVLVVAGCAAGVWRLPGMIRLLLFLLLVSTLTAIARATLLYNVDSYVFVSIVNEKAEVWHDPGTWYEEGVQRQPSLNMKGHIVAFHHANKTIAAEIISEALVLLVLACGCVVAVMIDKRRHELSYRLEGESGRAADMKN